MSNSDYFEKVLSSSSQQICVVAGPGSGKTKGILIPKAKSLIDNGTDPKTILLLSFSRLSALDLKSRVQTLGQVPRAATVHAFCLQYLLSENDHAIRDRIKSIAMDFELDYLIHDLKLLFPKVNKKDLRKQLKEFSAGWATMQHEEVFEQDDNQRRYKAAVINWLSEHTAVMMEEIVYFALDHIKKSGKPEYLNGIEYIFVDEYQDLNKLEQEFIKILGEGSKLLLTVGDPDQSIYSFKFAWKDGIQSFYNNTDTDSYTLPFCGRCDKKILEVANQFLVQESPDRQDLPQPLNGKPDGSVDIRPAFRLQSGEYRFIVDSITERLESGEDAKDILVLVPKPKLGQEFMTYLASEDLVLPNGCKFELVSRPKFTENQQARILLLSLIVDPNSVIHARSYLGLGDDSGYALELKTIKEHYGSWSALLSSADPDDFPRRSRRIREVCKKVQALRDTITTLTSLESKTIIDRLFPDTDEEFTSLNKLLKSFDSDGTSISDIYSVFIEYIRSIPQDDKTIQVMTIMASKGLEASHVYIMGCNAGNIPGTNRTNHLSDFEHKQEQRRFLYVGFTRARNSVTVTWTKHIPYRQSKNHSTPGIRTTKINGQLMTQVGICEFLQDLTI